MKMYMLFMLALCAAGFVNGHSLHTKKANGGGSCSGITIISRAQWGARAPKTTTNIRVPVHEFFIHHTDTSECFNLTACSSAVRSIQDFHMDDRGWSDIGYSFLVGEDGYVYEGRGWQYVGAHTKGYNSQSFGASVIGDYMDKLPNDKALYALRGLIACGVELGKIIPEYRLYGHRDAGSTSCPGTTFYHLIQNWPHYSHLPPNILTLKERLASPYYNGQL